MKDRGSTQRPSGGLRTQSRPKPLGFGCVRVSPESSIVLKRCERNTEGKEDFIKFCLRSVVLY